MFHDVVTAGCRRWGMKATFCLVVAAACFLAAVADSLLSRDAASTLQLSGFAIVGMLYVGMAGLGDRPSEQQA